MSAISLGDLAQSFMMRKQNVTLKYDIQRLSTEMTTGRVTDTAARVSGDLLPISGIDATLARLKGYSAVTSEAGLFAGAMQTALGVVDGLSQDLSASLLAVASGGASSRVDAVGGEARQKLGTVLSALNTRFGDRTLFAGTETAGPAIADTETMLAALDSAVVGATSAADVQAAVSAWFDAPDGYAALGYKGGAPLAALTIAPGDEARLDITANDPAIRDTLKGLAMAAMLDRGVLAGNPTARQDLAKFAGTQLMESQANRTNLAARLGMVEAQIDAAGTRNSAETAALQIARNDIVAVDPFETASKLEESQAQLEKIYAITARMSRLSLLDYL
jgi:flagellar hook-associated protein 3 FlgL